MRDLPDPRQSEDRRAPHLHGIAHKICIESKGQSRPPQPVPPIDDPLTLALIEIGRQRLQVERGPSRPRATVLRARRETLLSLSQQAAAVYPTRQSLEALLGLRLVADPSLDPGQFVVGVD